MCRICDLWKGQMLISTPQWKLKGPLGGLQSVKWTVDGLWSEPNQIQTISLQPAMNCRMRAQISGGVVELEKN